MLSRLLRTRPSWRNAAAGWDGVGIRAPHERLGAIGGPWSGGRWQKRLSVGTGRFRRDPMVGWLVGYRQNPSSQGPFGECHQPFPTLSTLISHRPGQEIWIIEGRHCLDLGSRPRNESRPQMIPRFESFQNHPVVGRG